MTPAAQITLANFEIRITGDVGEILEDWKGLESQALSTPFQTQAWLLPLYESLAPALNAKPLFALVSEKSRGRPVMLLPLCVRRRHGVRVIEFADLGVSDYNAPLIAPDFELAPQSWTALWRKILRLLSRGSILHFEKMPPRIGERPNPLVAYSPKARKMEVASWGVSLPASFAEYDSHVLHQTFARELARKGRRVGRRGTVDYALAQTAAEKRAVFDILARQRQARCDEMGRPNILAERAYRQFYEAVAVESPIGLATLGRLRVGSETVGTVLSLNHRGASYVLMSTYQGGDWKSCSLGNVVIQSAVKHSIEQRVGYFDLTIGNEGYKQHFGATPSPLYALMQPLNPLGTMVAQTIYISEHVKKVVKSLQQRAPQPLDQSGDDT
jgi:CelD/BcsL family acetyltransferase involved in cellulose biosynthesis